MQTPVKNVTRIASLRRVVPRSRMVVMLNDTQARRRHEEQTNPHTRAEKHRKQLSDEKVGRASAGPSRSLPAGLSAIPMDTRSRSVKEKI